MNFCLIVAWHNPEQRDKFLESWKVDKIPDWLILQQDKDKSGCAKTKNIALQKATEDYDVCIILDDDCYRDHGGEYSYSIESDVRSGKRSLLENFAEYHLRALEPQPVELYEVITDPPSRGTPYFNRTVTMPVAASMGFWNTNPDYDAPSQLVHRNKQMEFKRKTMFWRFFPFSGMNCAFRSEFWPHFKFDETAERYDDIFMGYRLQSEAYKRGYCINLNAPMVCHIRQSNVWKNLKIEAENIERNEQEWQQYVAKPCKP